MTVKNGTYNDAKISDYGLNPDKNDNLRVWVQFTIKDGENEAHVRWSNDFSDKIIKDDLTPKKISLANLKKMGLQNDNVISLYDGRDSKALNELLDFSVVVDNGYVKYINLPGEGPGRKFSSKEEAIAALAKVGVQAEAKRDYLK